MIERKIDEVFYSQVLKKWLRVREDAVVSSVVGCVKCVCSRLGCVAGDSDCGECSAKIREDGKNVHFEETEAPKEGGER